MLVVASSMSLHGEGRYCCAACGPVPDDERLEAAAARRRCELPCPTCETLLTPIPTPKSKTPRATIRTELGYTPKVTLREGLRELVAGSREAEAVDRVDQATAELRSRGLA